MTALLLVVLLAELPVVESREPPPLDSRAYLYRWDGEARQVVILSTERALEVSKELQACEPVSPVTVTVERGGSSRWYLWLLAGVAVGVGGTYAATR